MRSNSLLKIMGLLCMSLCSVSLFAQGIIVHTKDGQQIKYPYETFDSITVYQAESPLPEVVRTLPYGESFANSMGDFKNYTTSGEGTWQIDHRGFVKASGFVNVSLPSVQGVCYLVSPEISLQGISSAHVSYNYLNAFSVDSLNQQFMINWAFDERRPAEGWVALKNDHARTSDWNDWRKAEIQLPAEYMGKKVRVAFRYECNSDKASTFELKAFSVEEGLIKNDTVPEVKPDGDVQQLPYVESFSDRLGFFENVTTSGTGAWKIEFNTAKASAYDNATQSVTAGTYYLVSPVISLKENTEAHLSYEYLLRFLQDQKNQQVLVSANYDSANPAEGWVSLHGEHKESVNWKDFNQCDIQLPAQYMGKEIRIAFRFHSDSLKSAVWELKNFKIEAGKAQVDTVPEEKPDPQPDPQPMDSVIFASPLTGGLDSLVNYGSTSEWCWNFDPKYICAKVSGYVGGKEGYCAPGVAYLVTPEISLEKVKEAYLTYSSAIGYMTKPEKHQVLITSQFDSSSPQTGWSVLKPAHQGGTRDFQWMGERVQIPGEFMGKKVRLAFYYSCDSLAASLWELKNLQVIAGSLGDAGGADSIPEVDSLIATNGDFETWVDSLPSNWKSASMAGNGKLLQSSDAHGGKYSVQLCGDPGRNMRLAYQEKRFKAGLYTMTFYAKSVTANGGSVCPGIVQVQNGHTGSYLYGSYIDLNPFTWTKVEQAVEVPVDGDYCAVIMNAKRPGRDVLIDDFTLTDANGNLVIK